MAVARRGAFTREERRAAVWAVLIACVIAAMALMAQQWTRPSLGPWSAGQAAISTSDVLDARPVAASAL